MLFISHDLAVVAQIADRVAVMRQGMLLETGTRDQVFLHPGHAYTKSLLGAVPTLTTDRDQPLATLAAADSTPELWSSRLPATGYAASSRSDILTVCG